MSKKLYNKLTKEQITAIEMVLNSGGTKVSAAETILGRRSQESSIRNAITRGDINVNKMVAPEAKEVKHSRNGKISYTVPDIPTVVDRDFDNSRILVISDLHIPYHHVDALEFLAHLAEKYKPTRVICLGDELDKHAMSFHASDPDLKSSGDELKASLPIIQ